MTEEEEEIIMELKKMSTITTTLPQEIIIEILSWLPAKSLINSFNFVCKAWRNLIQDPAFIKMHLNQGAINGGGRIISHNNSNHDLIFKTGNELFQLHPCFNYEGLPVSEVTKLDFGLSSSLNSRLVGSCNGLLCISFNTDESIILLNPSTRKYKVLPKDLIEWSSQFKSYDRLTYGFGCCHNSITKIDEYKVVKIACFYPPDIIDIYKNPSSFQFEIDIYSMSSNSWRRMKGIKGIPYLISEERTAIFVSGVLHWIGNYIIGYDYDWDAVLCFDIRDEEFRRLPKPPCEEIVDNMGDMILVNLRGLLGILCVTYTENMGVDLEIWVMKEYGIRESWTRECVIRSSNTDPPRALSGFSISLRSTASFLKGDQILINGRYGRLALYDMNTKKIDGDFKIVGVPDESIIVDQVDYIETLVPLKSTLPSFG